MSFTRLVLSLATALVWGMVSAETVVRTAETSALSANAVVFAIPNGYSWSGVSASSGVAITAAARTMNGVTLVPVSVTGATERVTLTASFASGSTPYTGQPSKVIRERIRSLVVNPEDVPLSKFVPSGAKGSLALPEGTVDVLIVTPPKYTNTWVGYAEMRKASHPELNFAVVDTADIYAAYPYDSSKADGSPRNPAESIHQYLRTKAKEQGVSYVILGGSWINAQSLDADGNWIVDDSIVYMAPSTTPATWEPMSLSNCVPGVIANPAGAHFTSDAFYACLDLGSGQTYPWCVGDSTTYYETGSTATALNDHGVDVVVARIPLKTIVAGGTKYGPEQVLAAYTNKLARAESPTFSGTGRIASFWNENTYNANTYVDGRLPQELEFYDDAPNFFAADRPVKTYDDVEEVQRTVFSDHLAKYRPIVGVDSINDRLWTRGYASASDAFEAFKTRDFEYIFNDSHGNTSGSDGVGYNSTDFLNVTGLTLFNDASIPCDTGPQNLTSAYGTKKTSNNSFGEVVVMAPRGGCLASVNNAGSGLIGEDIKYNIYSYVMLHGGTKAFLADNLDAGQAWLQAHLDYLRTEGASDADAWVLAEHTLFGDPLVRARAPQNVTATDGVFPTFASNAVFNAASEIVVSGSNAVLSASSSVYEGALRIRPDDSATVGRLKVMKDFSVLSGTITFDGVEGGIGGKLRCIAPSKVVLNNTGRFYLGGTEKIGEVVFTGANAILNCDNIDSTLTNITFQTSANATNVLRGVSANALAGVTLVADGGTVLLESADLFNGNTFELRNGASVVVGPNPSQGSQAASSEPLDAIFRGTGTVAGVAIDATANDVNYVYAVNATFTSFVDAAGAAVALQEGDVIVVDGTHYTGGVWNCKPDNSVSGHRIVWSLSQSNIKNIPTGVEIEISSGCTVFLWCDIGANALITGDGKLDNSFDAASGRMINDGAVISCSNLTVGDVTMSVSGSVTITSASVSLAGGISLSVGAELSTTAKLTDGQVTAVTGARLATTTSDDSTVYLAKPVNCDENGIEPYHWYRFDGDSENSGEVSMIPSSGVGNTGYGFTVGAVADGQAADDIGLWANSGLSLGTGDWTIAFVGKLTETANGVLFAVGSKSWGSKKGIVFKSRGTTNPGLVVHSFGGNYSFELAADLPNGTGAYHQYALTYADGTYTLCVDGVQQTSQASAFVAEDGYYQFGATHGGAVDGTASATDNDIDDFRVYHQALTEKQLQFVAATFGFVDIKTLVPNTFEIANDGNFKLNGTNFLIRCAEMHFARMPRAYWRQRIQMAKAGGFNAVCAYMFWNNHEPEKGYFRFGDNQDIAYFCQLAKEEGMWVVLRPGPYVCAEWEYGGFPWWFRKEGVQVRTLDEKYMHYSQLYLNRVFQEVGEYQITRGGNILMVQVENEYGFYGSSTDYMRACYNSTKSAGFTVPLFCCAPKNYLSSGYIPELFPVINGGSGFTGEGGGFETLQNLRKGTKWEGGPLMVGEYYPAWYDSWGNAHQTKSTADCVNDLTAFCENNASFSMYMTHGGTSWGWWGGFNEATQAMTPSYDFNAPISEAGHYTEKFWAFKEVLDAHLNAFETAVPSNAVPAEIAVQTATVAAEAQYACFWDMADETFSLVTNDTNALTFELADLGYGYLLYETTIPAGLGGTMTATVKDVGVVRIDGEEVGYFDYRHKGLGIEVIASDRERKLQIFVEAFGRSHFYLTRDVDNGIQSEVKIGDTKLENWTMKTFNLIEHRTAMSNVVYTADTVKTARSASLYKYTVNLEYGKDTFLDMHDWKRGMVCVNGHWIGRYWSIGPQQDLYVPGCWLNESGTNEVIVLDLIGAEPPTQLKFIADHVIDELRASTDYFNTGRATIAEGSYTDSDFAYKAEIVVAGGTLESPVVITNSSVSLSTTQITILSNCVLKIVTNGNKILTVSGQGESSVLVVEGTKDWGFNAGAKLENLTLIVDDGDHKFWFDARTPAVFDTTVDVVLTNGSPVVIGGGIVTVGSLSGDGDVTVNGGGKLVITDPVGGTDFTEALPANTAVVVAGNDITSACTNGKLDPEKSATVFGEPIPVDPTLGTIENDAEVGLVPFAVSDEESYFGIKTIPGLTYHLIRGSSLNGEKSRLGEEASVTNATATSTRTKLVDPKRPSGKAFYYIRLTK